MNVSKEMKGYNSKRIKQKANLLSKFITKFSKELGHRGLDEICSDIFDYLHYDDTELE